jgi:hypothetical protein
MVRDSTLTVTVLGEIVNGIISSKKASKPKVIKSHFVLFSDILAIVDEPLAERAQSKVRKSTKVPNLGERVLTRVTKIGQKEGHVHCKQIDWQEKDSFRRYFLASLPYLGQRFMYVDFRYNFVSNFPNLETP